MVNGMHLERVCVHHYRVCTTIVPPGLRGSRVLAATLPASKARTHGAGAAHSTQGGWCIALLLSIVATVHTHLAGYAHSLQLEAADCNLAAPAVSNSGRWVEHLYSFSRLSRSAASFPISVCICHWKFGGTRAEGLVGVT